MAGGRRAGDAEYAGRVNAAAELAEAGAPAAEAATVLAARFAVSVLQARRYVDQAAAEGRVEVPEASVVFTVKLPAGLAGRVRACARDHDLRRGRPCADRVLRAGPQRASTQVSGRAVETEFVFGRRVCVKN